MIIKHYAATLPADYDMAIIRQRVADKGPAFDHLPGLGVKIFLIREKGCFGAASNQYAPVYLWPEIEPIWNFVAGDGFAGIVDSFGWIPIHTWLGLAFARDERGTWIDLRSVSREDEQIMPGTDLKALRQHEIQQARWAVNATPDLFACAIGVDTESWSLVRFKYWSCGQGDLPAGTNSYEALHISAPQADKLRQT
jgi:hypothetical protein